MLTTEAVSVARAHLAGDSRLALSPSGLTHVLPYRIGSVTLCGRVVPRQIGRWTPVEGEAQWATCTTCMNRLERAVASSGEATSRRP